MHAHLQMHTRGDRRKEEGKQDLFHLRHLWHRSKALNKGDTDRHFGEGPGMLPKFLNMPTIMYSVMQVHRKKGLICLLCMNTELIVTATQGLRVCTGYVCHVVS